MQNLLPTQLEQVAYDLYRIMSLGTTMLPVVSEHLKNNPNEEIQKAYDAFNAYINLYHGDYS